jgi:malonyl-CoA decarboxylase
MSDYVSPGLFERLGTLWRDLVPPREERIAETLRPDLPEDDLKRVRRQMDACLEGKGGDVSARTRAAQLGNAYISLDATGKERFLRLMATGYDTDHDGIERAVERRRVAADAEARAAAERALRKALEAPRRTLLKQFNALPDGVKFLVDMRAELMGLVKRHPDLAGLENDLKYILMNWFDVGFLDLRRITWDSPASILEKIIAYEAVHAIRSWEDLKNRLDSDRRLYAFFHPRMPDEPLIFVQVALINGMADSIQSLLDVAAPVGNPETADTAIFYSISNAQRGLDGISFGNFLIKRVAETLSQEFPNLKTFATLSPLPTFAKWLEARLAEGEPGLLSAAEHKALTQLARSRGDKVAGAKGVLKALLESPEWWCDDTLRDALKAPMLRLAARYLAVEKRPPRDGGRPTALDPVAHFHLSNGARIERLNWLGDVSDKGLRQSAGVMVNYLYKLHDIERNHETYSELGKAVLSTAMRAQLKD